ncbi:MAG TPA: hypothetical protein VMH87_15280 [Pseudomonadales bacterium]|nr:hypothetical protein [Pseudomonadales bacterium]
MALVAIATLEAAFLCKFALTGDRIFCAVMLVLLAFLLICLVVNALLSGRIALAAGLGNKVVYRIDTPVGYWLAVCFYAALGAAILFFVILMDYQVFEQQTLSPPAMSISAFTVPR